MIARNLGIRALALAPALALACLLGTSARADFIPFEAVVVDPAGAGDIKMVGDLDGDGLPDLVVAGKPAEGLGWYRNPDWRKTVVAVPAAEFTTDGELGDVDGDGDLDVVVPDGDGPDNLLWFENPRPGGDPAVPSAWRRHVVGSIGGWGKDIELADLDGDGRLDVATRHHGLAMAFFQTGPDTWSRVAFERAPLGGEGMAGGDLDRDGDTDLMVGRAWLANPGGAAARDGAAWRLHPIGDVPENFKAVVVDLDRDGVMDVLTSSSEDTAEVRWWTPAGSDPKGPWVSHTVAPPVEQAHTLQAADMDLDGDLDVVVGQMHSSADRRLMVFLNRDGTARRWDRQVVDAVGLHNGVVADIDRDGDPDIFGANWTGNPPVRLWLNRTVAKNRPLPLDRWGFIEITGHHARTFGLGFGDLDGDGLDDVVSGPFAYLNPGGDLTGHWRQVALPAELHAFAALDLDGDGRAEVLAQEAGGAEEIGLHWLTATDGWLGSWRRHRFGAVPRASHAEGAQGYRVAQVEPGGRPEVAVSSGDGLWYFRIPPGSTDDPAAAWPRVHVGDTASDEGFAIGDLDGDGRPDMAATTGAGKQVEWYRNPGDGRDDWEAFRLGEVPEMVFPDRTELADLDGDGRPDVLVTEENGADGGARTFWWRQPEGGPAAEGAWDRRPLTVQASTNSLDVADLDRDGDPDPVTAEHRGARRVIVWENDGRGTFTPHEIARGRENHLGARLHDLDRDGDLDLVGIAWDDHRHLWLWRNDAVTRPADTAANDPFQAIGRFFREILN